MTPEAFVRSLVGISETKQAWRVVEDSTDVSWLVAVAISLRTPPSDVPAWVASSLVEHIERVLARESATRLHGLMHLAADAPPATRHRLVALACSHSRSDLIALFPAEDTQQAPLLLELAYEMSVRGLSPEADHTVSRYVRTAGSSELTWLLAAARACHWFEFAHDGRWFAAVAWDVGLLAIRPGGREVVMLAATDTD